MQLAYKARESIISKIKEIIPNDNSNILTGLILGVKTDLSKEIQEDFRNSSLSHVLAVSGMHVGYVVIAIISISKVFNIGKRRGDIFLILGLISFMLIVGFTRVSCKGMYYGNIISNIKTCL